MHLLSFWKLKILVTTNYTYPEPTPILVQEPLVPTVYETKWFRQHWSFKRTGVQSKPTFDRGFLEPDWDKIDKVMNDLTDTLNNEGWEIKSAIPLISSEYSTTGLTNSTGVFQGQWGGGYGYGAGYTDGVILICQRATEISEEESATRRAARVAKLEAEARQAAAKKAGAAVREEEIQIVSKGMFKSDAYRYEGVEYASRADAEAKREAKAVAAETLPGA